MGKDLSKVDRTVFVCCGGSCKAKGAEELLREIRCDLKIKGLHQTVHTVKTYCMGQCESAPVAFIEPDGIWYKQLEFNDIQSISRDHLLNDIPVKNRILFKRGMQTMMPARVVKPKTRHYLTRHVDPYAGEVYGASIYPWEFNTYPLICELFKIHRKDFSLWHKESKLCSTQFQVTYNAGRVAIQGDRTNEIFEFIVNCGRDAPDYPKKIQSVKLFHKVPSEHWELYFSNESEGKICHAEIPSGHFLIAHLLDNYIQISS